MHLSEQLAALERRCAAEAPHLVEDVRRARDTIRFSTIAPSLVRSVVPDPVTLAPTEADLPPDDTTAEVPTVPTAGPERYDDLGLLGVGGMGEVRRVRDRELNRVLAMKVIKAPLLLRRGAFAKFVEEAQATAQLQHPGIVPVHDMGRLHDGRVWFTMKEVKGATFAEVIKDGHAGPEENWAVALRRMVNTLHRASQAIAYAHERAVVHRDLKPENIMVGGYGEVLGHGLGPRQDWGARRPRRRRRGGHRPLAGRRGGDADGHGAGHAGVHGA